jgi:hypothetical protein
MHRMPACLRSPIRHALPGPRLPGLLAAVLVVAAGCVPPSWYATDVFCGSWEGRVCIVVNLRGEHGTRFAVYRS